ncbi:hypothetical protein [Desulfovibrio legallii]|uniref:hypothetical protein n=1 Tax=Desulfovibrio legallii TaxID=571438 RepID=UPI001178321B|nr:hypothetical protein [Desulfovibrio legallii]
MVSTGHAPLAQAQSVPDAARLFGRAVSFFTRMTFYSVVCHLCKGDAPKKFGITICVQTLSGEIAARKNGKNRVCGLKSFQFAQYRPQRVLPENKNDAPLRQAPRPERTPLCRANCRGSVRPNGKGAWIAHPHHFIAWGRPCPTAIYLQLCKIPAKARLQRPLRGKDFLKDGEGVG